MAKTFVAIRMYSDEEKIRHALKELNVEFTERDFKDIFWGTVFAVEKPRGKGAQEKMRILRQLADPIDYKKTKWFG